MKKEKLIEVVKSYLNDVEVDTDGEFMSKVWSSDLDLDEVDLNELIYEVEDAFATSEGDAPEIVFNNREQMEALVDSTVEELISFILSKLQ